MLDFGEHGPAIRHADVILAGTEKIFGVRPRRAYQWNAAGERLENANRGNATEAVHILPPRDVQRDAALTVDARALEVRQISAVLYAGFRKFRQRFFRIANTMHNNFLVGERD